MTTVTGVNSGNQQDYMRNTGNVQLDKHAFLELLITQLRYQDPLKPTDNGEFLAQMAQFTSLEQVQNINTSLEQMITNQTTQWDSLLEKVDTLNTNMDYLKYLIGMSQYAAIDQEVLLLDKIVTVQAVDGELVTGKVTAVKLEQTGNMLVVNNETYSLAQLVKVHGGELNE